MKTDKNGKMLKGKNTSARRRRMLANAWAFNHIMKDEPREDIVNGLSERYGYTIQSAKKLYEKALQRCTNRLCMEAKNIYDRNLNRLEGMIDDSIEEDDMGAALNAIKEQNRMIGVGEKKNITIQNGEETPEFKIKIED